MENNRANSSYSDSPTPPMNAGRRVSKANKNLILGLIVLIIVAIGGIASLYLTQVSQDIRQQASVDDPYTCNSETHHLVNGQCIPIQCHLNPSGIVVCGYPSDADVCTTDSMGGDWCVDQDGNAVSCASLGLIRCECSDGAGGGWWVIGAADSCSELCDEAQIDCADCPPGNGGSAPTPTTGPSPTPTTGPSPTPTLTPTAIPSQYPTPTDSPIGPQCRTIKMYDPDLGKAVELTGEADVSLQPGDEVNFVCSADIPTRVGVGYAYMFRIYEPCGSDNHYTPIQVQAQSWGLNYTIPIAGDYVVQCAICNNRVYDPNNPLCEWEPYTPTTCE